MEKNDNKIATKKKKKTEYQFMLILRISWKHLSQLSWWFQFQIWVYVLYELHLFASRCVDIRN